MSSNIHFIFLNGITMSLFEENILSLLFVPGTMIDVVVVTLIVGIICGTVVVLIAI